MGANKVDRKLLKKVGTDLSPSRVGDDILMPDNDVVYLGTGKDGELFHDGTNTYFQNNTGEIIIENDTQDADITFKVNDGGVDTTVLTIDGPTGNVGIGTTNPVKLLTVGSSVSSGDQDIAIDAANAWQSSLYFYNAGSLKSALYRPGNSNDLRVWTTTNGDSVTFQQSGNVGIGTTSPTAYLHIKAGTASASTAPIKLTSGTVNTTPEAGTIEFDGSFFYLSI